MLPLLNIDSLTRSYPGAPKPLFDEFSMSLQPGQFLFLTGKSGAGKTTLTRFITGEITPPTDSVFFHRQDLARLSTAELQEYRKQIGIVFQDFKLLPWKTMKENILFPLALDTVDPTILDQALQRVSKLLNITHTLDSYPETLSGGEQQRAAIARALIRSPEFLIMDEPTGNIDKEASQALLAECFALNQQGITIIFVTHDLSLIDHAQHQGRNYETFHVS